MTDRPLRIAVVTGTFHPEPGGPPTYLYHLLPELVARGHAIRVLTYGEADAPTDYPYTVRRISRRQSIPRRLVAFSRAAWELARWADVCFVQGYGLPLIPAQLRFRRPVVIKIVSDFAWEFARRHAWIAPDVDVNTFQQMPLPWRVRLVRWQQTLTARLARAVIVPSAHVQRLVIGWGIAPEKVHLIYNAAPPERDLPPTREAARAALGLPEDRPLLLSVGRLTAVKGFDVAIRALADLPDAALIVIGDGEDADALETLADETGVVDRVIFCGRREHRDVLIAMRACDVFVLSSHTEGLSHVLLEALSAGKPAVATAVGGNPEVITHGESGLLVPPGDPAALAGAIRRVLDDPALAQRLGDGARVRSAAFAWEALVAQTESLLRGTETGHTSPPGTRRVVSRLQNGKTRCTS